MSRGAQHWQPVFTSENQKESELLLLLLVSMKGKEMIDSKKNMCYN